MYFVYRTAIFTVRPDEEPLIPKLARTVRVLWADERFIAFVQHEPAFPSFRVLTNLL